MIRRTISSLRARILRESGKTLNPTSRNLGTGPAKEPELEPEAGAVNWS